MSNAYICPTGALAGRALAVLVVGLVAALSSVEATAQTRPALVRSVDEPARVPYSHDIRPTCPFGNQCVAEFPVVPAGKRLRLTSVRLAMRFTNVAGFFAVHVDAALSPLIAFPVSPFNGAFYGNLTSGNFPVDLIFNAGQKPVLEMGVPAGAGGINDNSANRFGVTGYLVDVLP